MPEGVRFLPHGMREDEGYGLTLDVYLQETTSDRERSLLYCRFT